MPVRNTDPSKIFNAPRSVVFKMPIPIPDRVNWIVHCGRKNLASARLAYPDFSGRRGKRGFFLVRCHQDGRRVNFQFARLLRLFNEIFRGRRKLHVSVVEPPRNPPRSEPVDLPPDAHLRPHLREDVMNPARRPRPDPGTDFLDGPFKAICEEIEDRVSIGFSHAGVRISIGKLLKGVISPCWPNRSSRLPHSFCDPLPT